MADASAHMQIFEGVGCLNHIRHRNHTPDQGNDFFHTAAGASGAGRLNDHPAVTHRHVQCINHLDTYPGQFFSRHLGCDLRSLERSAAFRGKVNAQDVTYSLGGQFFV